MKKIVIFFIIMITVFISCDKKLFDKRNKYLGEYDFSINISYINIPYAGAISDTTIKYKGKIEYGNEGTIKITYRENISISPELAKDGNLFCIELENSQQSSEIGRFISSDELEMSIRYGGIGAWYTEIVKGVKTN